MRRVVLVVLVLLTMAWSGEGYVTEAEVADAVRLLKPQLRESRVRYWASVLWEASREVDLDPLLVTAMTYRESSFKRQVRSEGGSIGSLQVKFKGLAYYHRPQNCNIENIRCNVRCGAAYLQWVKAYCGGSWDVWVGAYGMSRCPSEIEAKTLPSVVQARSIYKQIGGKLWR